MTVIKICDKCRRPARYELINAITGEVKTRCDEHGRQAIHAAHVNDDLVSIKRIRDVGTIGGDL